MDDRGRIGANLPGTLFLLLGVLLAALPMPGCGGAGKEGPGDRPAGGELRVGLAAEPDSLNPYLARTQESFLVANRVLPSLVDEILPDDIHRAGYEPALARSWEFSPDGRSLVFHLREGRWSDGTPVTCADLAFTLEARKSPDVAWRGAPFTRHILSVDCPGDHAAVFRFDAVYPDRFQDAITGHVLPASLSRVPFSSWRGTDWAKELPAGGPFRVAVVRPGQEIVLARNPGWYGDPAQPLVERLVLEIVPDRVTRMTRLLAGDLDVALDLAPTDAARLDREPGVSALRRPGWGYTYVGWNTLDPAAWKDWWKRRGSPCAEDPGRKDCSDLWREVVALQQAHPHPLFGDPRVRRAMTLAIDRDALVDTLLAGEGEVPATPILAPLPEHDPSIRPLPHDPEAARRLLREAGFRDADGDGVLERDGRPLAFRLLVQAGNSLRRDAAVMIERDLHRVGARVEIVPVENSSFYATLARRETDAWIAGWRTSLRVDMTEMLHARACGPEGADFGSWSRPEADRLAVEARESVDPDARARAFRAWERIFQREQPYTILYRRTIVTGVRDRVRGTESALSGDPLHGVERWSLAE